ncbi:hypothetical protein CFIMG_005634RA [Ceratocystis fimbriata CBS 114723]|uniref:Uncharacterized protein n=1 Tax=Ceratocystis fimbriata CBS 114723 TaxID=1035309 RepID=A0A2C5WXZ1_9PEZI|nr:hypothetical protein CFIMG_005634RA [Ceratocystis fimbriata CBS 114723]
MSSLYKTPFPASIAWRWLSLVPPSKGWETASGGQKPMAWSIPPYTTLLSRPWVRASTFCSLLLPGLCLRLATGRTVPETQTIPGTRVRPSLLLSIESRMPHPIGFVEPRAVLDATISKSQPHWPSLLPGS